MTLAEAAMRLRVMARSASVGDVDVLLFAAATLEHAQNPELPMMPAFAGIKSPKPRIIQGPKRADEDWTDEESEKLLGYRRSGRTRREIAFMMGRTPKAVERREDRLTPKPEQGKLL